jgi:hypothetical protein
MLGRPETVAPLLESLACSTPDAVALFVVSETDAEVLAATVDARRVVVAPRSRGDYAAKINAGVRESAEPLIFTGACDLAFRPGWLDVARRRITDRVQVVGTNDLCNRRTMTGPHSTHTLLTREYAGLPTIDGSTGPLAEVYLHEYVDDELVGTAIKRRAYAHEPASVVEHLHPSAGKAPWDDSYRAQGERMRADRLLFQRRRQLWR